MAMHTNCPLKARSESKSVSTTYSFGYHEQFFEIQFILIKNRRMMIESNYNGYNFYDNDIN